MEAAATTAAQIAASYAANKVFSYAKDKAYSKYRRYRSRKSMPSYKPTTFGGANARRNYMAAQRAAQAPYMRGRSYSHPNRRTGGLIDIEKKFWDQNGNTLASTGNWVNVPASDGLALPSEGNGPTQRDGRVFYVHSLHIRGRILLNDFSSTTARSDTVVRLALVWDTQCNNTVVVPNQVYEPGGFVTDQFRNLEYSSRFIVLKDKTYTIHRNVVWNATAGEFVGQEQEVFFKFNKTFKKPVKVRASGTSSAPSSITDNNFTLLCGVASGTDAVNIQYSSRARFTG